ncbi:diguanylate cyclase [Candidatus Caldatribacterium saccharofermentans]|uniref:diguanylate cyclase n=1 Tax=Candidatus Caldatribacterium saccharofermentans TaxID=1454753 RepID=UPI0003662507
MGLAVFSLGIAFVSFLPPASSLDSFLFLRIGDIVRCLKCSFIQDHLANFHAHWGFFEKWLPREVRWAQRTGKTITFAMINIDGLRKVNDEKEHAVEDRVLERFTWAVFRSIRGEDIAVCVGSNEVLFPFSGEESARKALECIVGFLGGFSFSSGVSI